MRIIILLSSTVEAVGIKTILREHFALDAHVDNGFFLTSSSVNKEPDWFVVDTDTLMSNLSFFLPRKKKTIVLSAEHRSIKEFNIIYTDREELMIVQCIKDIIECNEENGNNTASHSLSQREVEVLKLIASGLINKEIADKLNISINTVLTHRKNITAKLGIKSVSGLSFYAMMNGII